MSVLGSALMLPVERRRAGRLGSSGVAVQFRRCDEEVLTDMVCRPAGLGDASLQHPGAAEPEAIRMPSSAEQLSIAGCQTA